MENENHPSSTGRRKVENVAHSVTVELEMLEDLPTLGLLSHTETVPLQVLGFDIALFSSRPGTVTRVGLHTQRTGR